MVTVHMSVYVTNGCFIGGIFFIQPRKSEERCGMYIWNAEKEVEDTQQWSSLLQHKGVREKFCDGCMFEQHVS